MIGKPKAQAEENSFTVCGDMIIGRKHESASSFCNCSSQYVLQMQVVQLSGVVYIQDAGMTSAFSLGLMLSAGMTGVLSSDFLLFKKLCGK